MISVSKPITLLLLIALFGLQANASVCQDGSNALSTFFHNNQVNCRSLTDIGNGKREVPNGYNGKDFIAYFKSLEVKDGASLQMYLSDPSTRAGMKKVFRAFTGDPQPAARLLLKTQDAEFAIEVLNRIPFHNIPNAVETRVSYASSLLEEAFNTDSDRYINFAVTVVKNLGGKTNRLLLLGTSTPHATDSRLAPLWAAADPMSTSDLCEKVVFYRGWNQVWDEHYDKMGWQQDFETSKFYAARNNTSFNCRTSRDTTPLMTLVSAKPHPLAPEDPRAGILKQVLNIPGLDINAARKSDGRTALHLADLDGYGRLALPVDTATKILLQAGADANKTDINGDSPLSAAIKAGAFKKGLALAKHTNLSATNNAGQNAIQVLDNQIVTMLQTERSGDSFFEKAKLQEALAIRTLMPDFNESCERFAKAIKPGTSYAAEATLALDESGCKSTTK